LGQSGCEVRQIFASIKLTMSSAEATVSGKKRPRPSAAAEAAEDGEAGASAAKAPRVAVRGPLAVIAVPMAGTKLHKRLYKVVKKAAGAKILRRGVKEVVKAVRTGQNGCVGAHVFRLPAALLCCPLELISVHLLVADVCQTASLFLAQALCDRG